MVKVGVVGIGSMGTFHAKSLYEGKVDDAYLYSVCDINPERLAWARELHNVKVYDNFDAFIEDEALDAVIIATPHYDHPIYGLKAMQKGKHLLSEKPIGVFTKNVRDLNEYAEQSSLVFGIMYNQRTNPIYQKARELVQSGALGEIRRTNWIITNWYRSSSYYKSGGWRATWNGEGGGVLLNQDPHQLDLWQWICGMPKTVRAYMKFGAHRQIAVENDVTAYVEYENGASGVFVTSTYDYPGTNRFEIVGDGGQIIIENGKLVFHKLTPFESEFDSIDHENKFEAPNVETVTYDIKENPWGVQHIEILNNFIEAILYGNDLLAPGVEGINGLTISNAFHLSAFTNEVVHIESMDEDLFLKELIQRIEDES
ncbi:Gfo/Idh/MocA family protein [Candidatus Xianfuyuplasma coldseepsis]|uniref:Gfo/Idh/MocA family oxidoreductase n=1 Tax=Candidatus Xianfuyuplasma coldseepsis TaxID=2782163 RepID=A0A7L7KQS3_9MOLU|nr:Gfo/Idh/MocA family oxidoreductase [Xianfuyuplasma coldseepsis]QMS85073.1 Gfo/Idh/MocA family oxidoreductase [Xianfuyuplasma coldseepsis]